MKAVLLAAAALAGSTLAPAHAQAAVTCDHLEAALEELYVSFGGIKGEEVRDKIYRTTYRIADATNCGLYLDWDSSLTCWWTKDSETSARAAYTTFGDTIARCYPTWDQEPAHRDGQISDEAVEYRFFSMEWGDEDDIEMLLELNRLEEAGRTFYEVSFRLALMPL